MSKEEIKEYAKFVKWES